MNWASSTREDQRKTSHFLFFRKYFWWDWGLNSGLHASLFESHLQPQFFFFFLRQGLTMQPRLASNSRYSYLSLPCAGITSVHHHTQFKTSNFLFFCLFLWGWGFNSRLHVCKEGTLQLGPHLQSLDFKFLSQFTLRCTVREEQRAPTLGRINSNSMIPLHTKSEIMPEQPGVLDALSCPKQVLWSTKN
jgi:hypothetical protein